MRPGEAEYILTSASPAMAHSGRRLRADITSGVDQASGMIHSHVSPGVPRQLVFAHKTSRENVGKVVNQL